MCALQVVLYMTYKYLVNSNFNMSPNSGDFTKMLVIYSYLALYGSTAEKQTDVFCPNLRILFILTARDYRPWKVWLSCWSGHKRRQLPAGAIP